MSNSKIEWTNKTWNPVTGCTKVSQGCKNCYAETFYERFNGKGSFKNIICHEDRLTIPLTWKKPAMIFVNSMSDLFHEDVPFLFINAVFSVMSDVRHNTYQVLTKRPERMVEFFKWKSEEFGGIPWQPSNNVWLGVSVEDQMTADERIPLLRHIKSSVKFLSCEPLLGPIDLINLNNGKTDAFNPGDAGINWVIVGGESGHKARAMHPDWARSLRNQCIKAFVPFFFKQWGEFAPVHELSVNEPGIKNRQWVNFDPDTSVCRVGKKNAGRLLDGKQYNEFPIMK